MSKLQDLKGWLTIAESAEYLSKELCDKVSEVDLYRFCLDGHIKIAVNILHCTPAKPFSVVPLKKAKMKKIYRDSNGFESELLIKINDEYETFPFKIDTAKAEIIDKPAGLMISSDKVMEVEHNQIEWISGIFNLTMYGYEKIIIEELVFKHAGGRKLDIFNIDGTFIENLKATSGYVLHEKFDKEVVDKNRAGSLSDMYLETIDPNNYFPTCGFPEASYLVFLKNELDKFVQFINKGDVIERMLPEDLVKAGKKQGKTDKEIAKIIDAEWTGKSKLTNKALGLLFAKNEYVTDDAHEQRGKRLRGKKT